MFKVLYFIDVLEQLTLHLKRKLINPAFNRSTSKPHFLSRTQSNAASAGGAVDWTRKSVYPWFLPVQTRWMDNDQYGHVNNAVYHSIFDSVINGYLMRSDCLMLKSYCSIFVSNKEMRIWTRRQSEIVFGQKRWLATWLQTLAPFTAVPPTPTSTWPGFLSRR